MIAPLTIRAHIIGRNTLLNLVGQGIPLIVAVATMPTVIHGLGPTRFGILALSWALLSYFSVFDVGLARAATKFAAEALGRGDHERVGSVIWTVVGIQATLGILGGAALAVLAPTLAQHLFSNVADSIRMDVQRCLMILSVAVPIVLVAGSFRGILEAAQRFDLVNAVRLPVSIANYLVPLAGVLLGWTLPCMVGGLVLLAGVGAVATYLLSRPLVRPPQGVRVSQLRELRGLLSYGAWLAVSGAVSPILVYLDRLMIGTMASLAAVGFYAAPHEMVTRLLVIPVSLAATLFPAFSTLNAQDRKDTALELFARATKYVLLIVGSITAILVPFASQILEAWLGPQFAQQSTVPLQILAVGFVLNSLGQVPYSLLQATGNAHLTAKFHLIELPIHIGLLTILIGSWGIAGAALAWTIRVGLDATFLFAAVGHIYSASLRSFSAQRLPQTAVLLVTVALLGAGISALVARWWAVLTILLAVLVAAAMTAWRFCLDHVDRNQLVTLLRKSTR